MFMKKKKKMQEDLVFGIAAFAFMAILIAVGAVKELLESKK